MIARHGTSRCYRLLMNDSKKYSAKLNPGISFRRKRHLVPKKTGLSSYHLKPGLQWSDLALMIT